MNKLFVSVLVIGLAIFVYVGYKKQYAFNIEDKEDGIHVVKGDNKFLFEDGGDFNAEVRAFSVIKNIPDDQGPLAIITEIVIATSMAENVADYEKNNCEDKSSANASVIQIITPNAELRNKFSKWEPLLKPGEARRCLRIAGKTLTMKKTFYQGEDHTGTWQVSGSSKHDPNKFILLSDVEQITCE